MEEGSGARGYGPVSKPNTLCRVVAGTKHPRIPLDTSAARTGSTLARVGHSKFCERPRYVAWQRSPVVVEAAGTHSGSLQTFAAGCYDKPPAQFDYFVQNAQGESPLVLTPNWECSN